jgi:hypothetical protein
MNTTTAVLVATDTADTHLDRSEKKRKEKSDGLVRRRCRVSTAALRYGRLGQLGRLAEPHGVEPSNDLGRLARWAAAKSSCA